MAGKSNQYDTNTSFNTQPQKRLDGFQTAPASLLAQFTNATSPGYQPKQQITIPTPQTTSPNAYGTTQSTTTANSSTSTTKTFSNISNTHQPLPSQTIDLKIFKGLKFVTLDPLLIEARNIYDDIAGTYQWEMCNNEEERCMTFIRDECANKRAFLISSGGLGKSVIPKIHDLPQLYAIYIYCADVLFHQEWASKYSKVRVVCNDDDKYLIPQLAVDVAQANIDWGDALLQQGNRGEAKKKFEKALNNLTTHVKTHDPIMLTQVIHKLDQCK